VEDGQYNFWDDQEDVPPAAGGILEDFGPGLCTQNTTWVNQVGWGSWITLNGMGFQVGSGSSSSSGSTSGTTTTSQPPCDIELRTAGIPVAGKVGAVHSYLDVVDANGVTHILEGIQNSVKKSFLPGLTYLNGSDTLTGGLNIDNLASNPILFDSANNPALTNICDDVSALIDAADNFPVNKVRYDLLGKFFPNSNSFIRYLLTFIPNLGITAPPGAVGWSKPVLGQ